MQQYFRALLEAFQRASERHPPAEGAAEEQAGVPARDWAGWQHAAALVGVQGDAPAFRARQAIKVALAADAKNMGGEDVVWEQLEQRLEDILAGQTALEDLPDTQEDLRRQLAPPAVILLADQPNKSKKRAGAALRNYCVALEGQAQEEAEWYTHAELKKEFPGSYRQMLSDFEARQAQQGAAGAGGPGAHGEEEGAAAGGEQREQEPEQPGPSNQPSAAEQSPARNATTASREGQPELSAGKRAAATPVGIIPGGSCVPLQPAAAPQPLFQDSGPPASALLAGIRPLSPVAAASSAGGPSAADAVARFAKPKAARPRAKIVHQTTYPAPTGITRLSTGAAEQALRGQVQQRTVHVRAQRTALPLAPTPGAGAQQPGRAAAAAAQASPAVAGATAAQRLWPSALGHPPQQGAGLAALLTASLGREQQQQQQPPTRAAPAAAARPAGLLALGSRRAPGPLSPPQQRGALSPSPGASPQKAPAAQPEVDFSGVDPLLRPSLEYAYRTTGRLPRGAKLKAPPPALAPRPAKVGDGPDALLQMLRGPGVVSPQRVGAQAPALPPSARAGGLDALLQQLRQPHPASLLAAPPPALAGPAGYVLAPVDRPVLQRPRAAAQAPSPQRVQTAATPATRRQSMASPAAATIHQQQTASPAATVQQQQQQQVQAATAPLAAAPAVSEERPPKRSRLSEPAARDVAGIAAAAATRAAEPAVRPAGSVVSPVQQHQQPPAAAAVATAPGSAAAPAGGGWAATASEPSSKKLRVTEFMDREVESFRRPAAQPAQQGAAGVAAGEEVHQEPPAPAGRASRAAAQSADEREASYHTAREEQLPTNGGASSGQWVPPPQPDLRTQPDEVQWTAADAAGLFTQLQQAQQELDAAAAAANAAGLVTELQQAQQELDAAAAAAIPPTQVVVAMEEDVAGPSVVQPQGGQEAAALGIPGAGEQQLAQAAHAAAPAPSAEGGLGAGAAAAAAAAAAGPGGAEAKQEPGVEPVEAKQEELGQAQGEAVAGPAERPEGGLTLDELLQPGPWTKATIRGAKNRGDRIELWIDWDWGGGYKDVVPSHLLLDKPHCMRSLIQFYESKTRQRKTSAGAHKEPHVD